MHSIPHDSYLEAQVLTATPQKQRLMLIEGAIRFGRRTLELWEQGQDERALEALIASRNIASELLASISVHESDLTKRVAAIYAFVYRMLTEAQWRRSATCLQDALDVLAIEQETWQLVCQKMPEAPTPIPAQGSRGPKEVLAPATTTFSEAAYCGGSISLEA